MRLEIEKFIEKDEGYMRRTKIICTIGPASCWDEVMGELLLGGLYVARINFSHGTHESHAEMIARFRKVRDELKLPAAVMLDTKGPEIRLGLFDEPVEVVPGQTYTFSTVETPGTAEKEIVEIENLPAANKRIGEVRRKISALGTPNLGAIDEYARVSERYEYLAAQRDDVQHAKSELENIVASITTEMTEIFVREFARIDEYFGKTFEEMFGGGKASLILEDKSAPLECGIEIRVQPPGKQVKTITLLSGGEKAFVAIALYFAILKVRPTPFCMLDEIDAALDDRNVERFANYLHTLSDKTQFIVITHRRGTMEAANVLYGVTMQEDGVSKLLKLDLEQVDAELVS